MPIVLGCFHVQMNFAKVIGNHMENSVLADIWVESVYGQNTVDNIIKGKLWNRVIRAHKLTFEALWKIIWPSFIQWAAESNREIDQHIEQLAGECASDFNTDNNEAIQDKIAELLPLLQNISDMFAQYDADNADKPTFTFWRQYMQLVSILLKFTQAARDGNWALYLSAFVEMLPWFALYDHTNYTRLGTI